MKVEEYNPEHFHWMMVDNSDQSVFAFEREVEGNDLLFVFNMTPTFYPSFGVGCLQEGEYEEIFNSDKDVYGGTNQFNGLPLIAEDGAPEGRPHHVTIKLASYAACVLKRKIPQEEPTGSKKVFKD